MEDDDEFGDLYTDVLRPLQAQTPQADALPIDPKIYGASESKTPAMGFSLKLNSSALEKTLPRGGFRLDSRSTDYDASSFQVTGVFKGADRAEKGSVGSKLMEDDDINIVLEGRENEDDDALVEKKATFISREVDYNRSNVERVGVSGNLMDQGVALGTEQTIPGLSRKLENLGGANFEDDLESDESEDDLEIVLNDNGGGHTGIEMMKGLNGDDDDDGEGEPLVIVADDGDLVQHQQMMVNEQEWKGEDAGSGVDTERRALGYPGKADGGGAAVPAVVAPKTGFNSHMYPHPLHSQFKYVRPGAAPLPGTAPLPSGGVQGHARPPITAPLGAGRGRGDWRPTGIRGAVPMQKGFHPNYGSPASGSISGRGYGSGLDFTLPSHRTIFEVDIDGFEEKPWKFPSIDVSDFFNFGLNEESWKDYCKQLEQLRLATTMQSKIRVYESSRAEQDYDPDLPPELAAAVGNTDIHSEIANAGKVEPNLADVPRPNSRGLPPTLIGRPIPVEAGSGERVPSTDTRRLRLHDSDTIIEIICQGTDEEEKEPQEDDNDGIANHEMSRAGEARRTDGIPNNDGERNRVSVHPSSSRKTEVPTRRNTRKNSKSPSGVLHPDPEVALPHHSDKETETTTSHRVAKEKTSLKPMKPTAFRNGEETQVMDHQNEVDGDDVTENTRLVSSQVTESEAEPAATLENEVCESAADGGGQETKSEERAGNLSTGGDERLVSKKRPRSQVEQVSQDNGRDLDSKAAMGAENSKARSGNIKDNRQVRDKFEDNARNQRRPLGSENNAPTRSHREKEGPGGHHVKAKGREETVTHRRADPSISVHRQNEGENIDSRRESDISEGSSLRRDDDPHARRAGIEETRKRAHGADISSTGKTMTRDRGRGEKDEKYQSRNQLEKGAWGTADYDQDAGSKQRHWDDDSKKHHADVNDRRRRDGATYSSREQGEREVAVSDYKDSSSRRKRERNDGSDQRKGDDISRTKDDGSHHVRKKDEKSMTKERDERSRGRGDGKRSKESHEENFSRKEREATHADSRTGRLAEDKSGASRSRAKDHYKGSGRDDNQKDAGRHDDQVKRRDQSENEKVSQNRVHGDIHQRASQGSKGEKRARYDRTRASDDTGAVHASDVAKQQENQKKDSGKTSKEPEGGKHNSIANSQRNHDEHIGNVSETTHAGDKKDGGKAGKEQQSSKKQGEGASSEDDNNASKRGRSKLERWTSQKERDFGTASLPSSSSKRSKTRDTTNHTSIPLDERPPRKVEDKPPQSSANDREPKGDTNATTKPRVDDKHLDTVEKLKKRSERFKLPMPGEKDAAATTKKLEGDVLPPPPTENPKDSDVKPERPPRKRRWTGN